MAITPAIVLTVKCGDTLKTSVNGVPIEIVCEGDGPGAWTLPDPPSGSGGVVAYITAVEGGSRLDLPMLAERFQAGEFTADALPEVDAGSEWAIFQDEAGDA